jgi:hypothetical protein
MLCLLVFRVQTLMRELLKKFPANFRLEKVVEFLRQKEHMDKPLAEAGLVVSGRDVAIVREGELVSVRSLVKAA